MIIKRLIINNLELSKYKLLYFQTLILRITQIKYGNYILLDTICHFSDVVLNNSSERSEESEYITLCIQILRDAQDNNLVLTDISFLKKICIIRKISV